MSKRKHAAVSARHSLESGNPGCGPSISRDLESSNSSSRDFWSTDSIGNLFDIGAGKSVTPQSRNEEPKFPFLRTSNVFWGRVDVTDVDAMYFTTEEVEKKTLLFGDLLVCEGGDIGRSAIWKSELPRCAFQNHLHRLRPKHANVVPYFFMYYLQAGFTQLGIYEGAGNKTTIPNLSRSRLASMEVPVPSKLEQEKIAATLWTVQRAISTQDGLIAATADLKASVMQRLFTHGLRGEALKDTEIGLMPESWGLTTLGDCGRIGNGSTPKKTVSEYWRNPTTPWLTSAKVHEGIILSADQFVSDIAVKECHLPIVPAGSLLVAITGQGKTLGNSALVEFDTTISQHMAYVRFDRQDVFPGYVYQFMRSRYEELQGIGRAGGSTKAALTCGFLRDYLLPLPSLDEQRQIATVLTTIDRKLAHHRAKRASLHSLFQTLLHQLMTAQIRVDDLDIDTSEVVDQFPGVGNMIRSDSDAIYMNQQKKPTERCL